ncbi:YbaK/EbsC family protein [Leuconostoc holzapfelii]|uniref:YbaK/EbsC family protein n=1 Tax=Leuconostoc holzapfelii TaxID=434464 RepID=UPI0021BFEE46|nr:YbaK/EbsC family protein [Leuconostoc holzapfelii]
MFSLPVNSSLTLKDIAYITMNKKVSFASDQDLMNILSVSAGSVSILNALNDDNKSVEYYISNDILTETNVAYHPNQNNETVVFNGSEITKILDGYKLHVL